MSSSNYLRFSSVDCMMTSSGGFGKAEHMTYNTNSPHKNISRFTHQKLPNCGGSRISSRSKIDFGNGGWSSDGIF